MNDSNEVTYDEDRRFIIVNATELQVPLTSATIETILDIIETKQRIVGLEIKRGERVTSGVATVPLLNEILPMLAGLSNFTDLTLGHIRIGGIELSALKSNLENLSSLRNLDLHNNLLGVRGAIILSGLQNLSSLTNLHLNSNYIGEKGATVLSQVFPILSYLQSLDLGYNNIGLEGALAISKSLHMLQQLRSLILQSNNITSLGAEAVTDALSTVPCFRSLDFGYNHIDKEGAYAFAARLKKLVNLESLSLRGNYLNSLGAAAVCRELHECYLARVALMCFKMFQVRNRDWCITPSVIHRVLAIPALVDYIESYLPKGFHIRRLDLRKTSIQSTFDVQRGELALDDCTVLLTQIKTLRYINIERNTIVCVNLKLFLLPHLKSIRLSGNHFIRQPPKELCLEMVNDPDILEYREYAKKEIRHQAAVYGAVTTLNICLSRHSQAATGNLTGTTHVYDGVAVDL